MGRSVVVTSGAVSAAGGHSAGYDTYKVVTELHHMPINIGCKFELSWSSDGM